VNSDSQFLHSSQATEYLENKTAVQAQRISRNFIETRSSEVRHWPLNRTRWIQST